MIKRELLFETTEEFYEKCEDILQNISPRELKEYRKYISNHQFRKNKDKDIKVKESIWEFIIGDIEKEELKNILKYVGNSK